MMANIDKNRAKVFTLDTGRLNQETYDVMDAVRARYGIPIEAYFPDQKEVEDMVRSRGMNLMYESVENRKLCCEIRKVHPLNRALSTLDGWITGLRRDQVVTRATTKKIEIDSGHRALTWCGITSERITYLTTSFTILVFQALAASRAQEL